MKFELCTDSFDAASEAAKMGIHRIELCTALELGGLTPSYGLIKECVHIKNIETHVILRPRAGDFCYSQSELQIIENDIEACADIGVHGVVFGVLDPCQEIDLKANEDLCKKAKALNLEITFHRAFDFTPNPKESLQNLINLGFNRLLSSGQKKKAIEGVDCLKSLVVYSSDQIEIMAGSGVSPDNANELAHIKVDALHFTARKKSASEIGLEMGSIYHFDKDKVERILKSI